MTETMGKSVLDCLKSNFLQNIFSYKDIIMYLVQSRAVEVWSPKKIISVLDKASELAI